MSDNDQSNNLVNGTACDLLWGAAEIGRAIGRNGRQVFHLHRTGAVKSIHKVGGKLVASRAPLLRELKGQGAAS
jgi:hypothetical protein